MKKNVMAMMSFQTAALALCALALAACAQVERQPLASATDDDTACRSAGEPGSTGYVACRRDRDARVSNSNRMDRAHRGLAEDMLNNRR